MMTPDVIRRLVQRDTEKQDLPLRVSDPNQLRAIATLIASGETKAAKEKAA